MAIGTTNISFSSIQTEFGGSNPISLDEYYASGLYVPKGHTIGTTSGQIGTSTFSGKKQCGNYVSQGSYTVSGKFGSTTYYGWDTNRYVSTFGSINSSSVYYYTGSDKYGPIDIYQTWYSCVWVDSGTLAIVVAGDLRSSGPDNFRVGTTVTARTAFTRSYTSTSPARTTMTIAMATNPFTTTANYRTRVTNYTTSLAAEVE